MDDKVAYWLELARYDYESAKVMQAGGRYLYVGFMCHLTAEKALKAVVASVQEENPPKTHDLVKLAKLGGVYDDMSEDQQDFLDLLLPLNIEARYPSYKSNIAASLSKEKCAEILEETEALVKWLETKL